MAYFHCLIGGGSSGGGYELTVTCDADFAGTTITCTDGVTTLTQTCPSASPYEVVFEIPNGGDWTISGVVSGQTVTTGVNIPTSATLNATIQQTVIIHSAKEDTISYVDIDGATQTITFASGETSKQVQIAIEPNGSSITFTSSVAKNPNNLSQDYSKALTVTTNTTELYLMPENTLYWWGYESDNLENISTANGWSYSGTTFGVPSKNTNSMRFSTSTGVSIGVGSKNKVSASKVNVVTQGVTVAYNNYGFVTAYQSKSNWSGETSIANASLSKTEITSSGDKYIFTHSASGRAMDLYAFWYE